MPLLRCKESFATFGGRAVQAGDLVDSSDPIVKGREALFEEPTVTGAPVEQATAAPGEKRTRKAPAGK